MAHSQQQVLWVSEISGHYQIGHKSVPRPGPGFARMKVESCALDLLDKHNQFTVILLDRYLFIAGGTVEQIGEGISELNVSDRVFL